MDLLLEGDLDCSLTNGEEPDLLRLAGDLDFFNSKEPVVHFPSGEVDSFFSSKDDPDVVRLGGDRDFSLKAGGDPDKLCLRTGDLGFSFAARDLPDLLCCNGGVDFGSGEAVRLGGDNEFSFVDD